MRMISDSDKPKIERAKGIIGRLYERTGYPYLIEAESILSEVLDNMEVLGREKPYIEARIVTQKEKL